MPDTKKFTPAVCDCCMQTKNYAIGLDRGSALITLALANAIHREGRNSIHLVNDMLIKPGDEVLKFHEMIAAGKMTMRMIGNAARPRYHGLIAFSERGSGEYLLTRKGADFIHGLKVDRIAIIDKVAGKNAGYWEEGGLTSITELLKKDVPMWEGGLGTVREALAPESTNLTFPI